MEYGIIIASLLIAFVIIAWALQIRPKDLRRVKELGFDKELTKEVNAFPSNEEICREMLGILKNDEVQVKVEEGGKEKTSLYIVATNTIWIANIQDTFTRIQTIAHECLHSVQNKTTLWFQFLFSNLYPLYFIVISILTIIGVVHHPMIHAILLIIMGILFFCVRGYLEMDAMIKARWLAEKYMQGKDCVTEEKKQTILSGYDTLNQLGIKMALMQLWIKPILRVCVYCLIVILM